MTGRDANGSLPTRPARIVWGNARQVKHEWLHTQREHEAFIGERDNTPAGVNAKDAVAKRVARLNTIGMQWNTTMVQRCLIF